jgi:hypothetical protein
VADIAIADAATAAVAAELLAWTALSFRLLISSDFSLNSLSSAFLRS